MQNFLEPAVNRIECDSITTFLVISIQQDSSFALTTATKTTKKYDNVNYEITNHHYRHINRKKAQSTHQFEINSYQESNEITDLMKFLLMHCLYPTCCPLVFHSYSILSIAGLKNKKFIVSQNKITSLKF